MNQKLKFRPMPAPQPTGVLAGNGNGNASGTNAVCRLRLLIAELIQEVELIDYGHTPSVEMRLQQTDQINFYEEVARFEIALIKTALYRAHGHQVNAARLLNLNSSTLNAKIKQYDMGYHSSNDRWTSK
jgi:DNA-binding NtrC family response regulator